MHYLYKIFLCAILMLPGTIDYAQTIDPSYEVGTWQGFRSAAVTYTFDDNCPNQLPIAVPMFNEFDFKLTLFTVTNTGWGWQANWNGLQNAANQGHEIASHTVTHASFAGMADSVQLNELKNSQDVINEHITGKKCVTIAYPFCVTGNNSLVGQYYLAARGCSGSIENRTPTNFMNISSIVCGSQGPVQTSVDFKTRVDNAASTKGWVVYLFHGINDNEPGAYSPIAADTIRASLEYLAANPDKFWVATFGSAAKYIRERNAASISEISINEDSITVVVTDTLDNSYYDCSITIRRLLPQGWVNADVMQNGVPVTSRVVEINSIKYVMFDVLPDNGDVLLIKSNSTSVSGKDKSQLLNPYLMQNYPNPFNPSTKIRYGISRPDLITLKLYDTLGKEIVTLVNEEKPAGIYEVEYDAGLLSSGIYFYQLRTNTGFIENKKLVLLK
jgi:oligosaccharide reducing-end xylanase